MSIIEVVGIQKKYGDFLALDDVTLKIEKGDFFGLFGPNGAGKTTLLKILTGQISQTKGIAKVLGIKVEDSPMEVKRRVGIVPEVESPPSYLTAYEYLYFVSKVRKVRNEGKEIGYWLDFFDIEDAEDTLCKELSKGMRQKLMLASAFIHAPRVLFLDEPFINLDPLYQRRLRDYLKGYVENDGTVFMCTHILEIAQKLCTNVAIINKGKVAAKGTMDDLLKNGETLEDAFLRHVKSP